MTEEPIKVIGRECRFVVHIPSRQGIPDLHMVKVKTHYSDGTTKPEIQWIKDFKRPFYLTTQVNRNHKQKKEVEELGKLMKYESTQSELRDKVCDALGISYSKDQLKKISNNPYLYGTEIPSTSIIKKMYLQKNKNFITPYSVMSLDLETDLLKRTQDPIIGTAAMDKEAFIVVTDEFIEGYADPENAFFSKCREYLGPFFNVDEWTFTFKRANGPVELIRELFKLVHSKKPDFLAIWNMDFDIPKIISTLEKFGVDPATILCDPEVPEFARICKYRQGLKKKRKANGDEVPIDFADQWHSLTLTASFYVIDAMCTYRLLRLAKQKEPSYGLEAILSKELKDQKVRKLKFSKADGYVKERWHIFMQQNYKIEYMVYGIFDSISMILLDNKIMDLSFTLPGYAGITSFARCNSKPKMIADALHFYVLEKGYVLNSVGEQLEYVETIEEDEDESDILEQMSLGRLKQDNNIDLDKDPRVLPLTDWIMTLPAHLVVPGLPIVEESDKLHTKIRGMVYDSDCVSAYPTCTSILNVSKSTTKREIIDIKGIRPEVFRLQNINLCSGYVNALEYGKAMFGLPKLTDLENLID